MNKNKQSASPTRPGFSPGQGLGLPVAFRQPPRVRLWPLQTTLGSVLVVLLASSALLPQNATAQVRVYDATSGQSLPVGTPAPKTTSAASRAPSPTTPATSQIGGVRVDAPVPATPPATPKSNIKATSANSALTATSRPSSAGAAPLNTTVSSPRPYTPSRTVLDALGNPLPAAPAQNSQAPKDLGQALVFVNVSEFSPIVSKRLQELLKVSDLSIIYYMDERKPQEYMKLLGKDFFDVASDMSFQVDSGGDMAEAYGVTKGNTIVYRLPGGSVRLYSLVSEIGVFLEQINRVRQGEST